MKHLILVIAILTAAAQLQAQQPASCLELKKIKIDHHLLHQQGETQAELTFKARRCSVLQGPEKPDLAFASEPGISVQVREVTFIPVDDRSSGRAKEMRVSVRLVASPETLVGEHQLHGIMKYQIANSAGDVTPESLAISIPFKVAPPKSDKNEFVEGLKTTGLVLAEIAAAPVFLVFMMIWCPISGECPTC